ncbi:CBS domain-containing protein [Bowmanella denitrificans]|uniref:CBS domain-containing protein n=1 Tax=Bowmanella denitrificans TaxID=366582 RepID=UPI0031D72732
MGQRLWALSTALLLTHVDSLHHVRAALYKGPTNCCKIILKRSTRSSQQKISCLPVIDENRHPIGILSWRDILRLLSEGKVKRQSRAVNPPLSYNKDS